MQTVGTHKDLRVWKLSMDFVIDVYKVTKDFPVSERFGLTQQIRRAAVSIPSNIAEGAARRNTKEMIQFLYIALASVSELETQLELSRRLGYLKENEQLGNDLISICKMLIKLIRSLQSKLSDLKSN